MAAILSGEGFRFLFRTDKGEISRETWWLGTAMTGGIGLVATLVWFAVQPYANSDLSRRGLFDPTTFGVYVYLMLYAFIVLLTTVCWYNLSAKRFRAVGRASSFAGLPLALALVTGAAHWVAPRVPDMVPYWSPWVLDAALVVVILWTLNELGIRSTSSS
jgi:uncharacterized membrane protein YhaH (DUF805 family)